MFEDKFETLGGIEPVVSGTEFSIFTEEQINSLEREIGYSLPEGYRIFLKKYAGSRPRLLTCFQPLVPLPINVFSSGKGCFDFFMGAIDDYSLEQARKVYRDRIPNDLLPIGGDLAGGVICLGLVGIRIGKIYYWDPKNEWDIEEDGDIEVMQYQNIHLIADSFNDFINRLEVSPFA